jgi:hypothetical protein
MESGLIMATNGLGRSLYVGLKADTKGFGKSLSNAEKNLKRFKTGVKVLGTAVAASFAAMGAAALLFGKSAITAALDDQKSQVLLAKTIKNNAKNRNGLIKDSEKTISALESQYNIVDDKLRPAFAKLVTTTKSVSKSQKLIRTAIDVSAISGKSLDSVVTAISKSYLGSNTALGKLGLGIDKTKLKTMKFDDVMKTLTKTTGGGGKAAAGTYQGAVDGLSIAWGNFQESVGYKILPKLQSLLSYIKKDVIPFLGEVKKGFEGVGNKNSAAVRFGEAIRRMVTALTGLFSQFGGDKINKKASSLEQLADAFTKIADGITSVTTSISGMVNMSNWDRFKWFVGKAALLSPIVTIGKAAVNKVNGRATGGPVNRNTPYVVGENGPEIFVPSGSGAIRTNRQSMGSGTTVINLNGIVDAESARRSIERLLQTSSLRTGNVVINKKVWSA